MIIDTHCHLDFIEFKDDFSIMLDNAKKNDVLGMQTICTKIEEFPKILNIALKQPNIWCSIGTHPHNAEDEDYISKEQILEQCNNDKVIGIGETGLDYFYENSKRDIQIKSLYKHIEVSKKTNLPIIIHARDADDDIIEILTTEYKKEKFFIKDQKNTSKIFKNIKIPRFPRVPCGPVGDNHRPDTRANIAE